MSSMKFSLLVTEESKHIMQIVGFFFFSLEVLVEKDNVISYISVEQILCLLS